MWLQSTRSAFDRSLEAPNRRLTRRLALLSRRCNSWDSLLWTDDKRAGGERVGGEPSLR